MLGKVISGSTRIERTCHDMQSWELPILCTVSAIQAIVGATHIFRHPSSRTIRRVKMIGPHIGEIVKSGPANRNGARPQAAPVTWTPIGQPFGDVVCQLMPDNCVVMT